MLIYFIAGSSSFDLDDIRRFAAENWRWRYGLDAFLIGTREEIRAYSDEFMPTRYMDGQRFSRRRADAMRAAWKRLREHRGWKGLHVVAQIPGDIHKARMIRSALEPTEDRHGHMMPWRKSTPELFRLIALEGEEWDGRFGADLGIEDRAEPTWKPRD